MNLKTTKIAGLALIAGLLAGSTKAQQVRSVGDFNGVKVGDAFTVIISQADANTVSVSADEKEQPQIKTEVKDGILILTSEGKGDMSATINVGIKSLSSLEVTGAADVKNGNQLICDKINIESNGAGDIHLNLKASEIKTKVSGAGDVILTGSAPLLDAKVSGSGYLKATDLETDKTIVKVSGAGDAKVNVKKSIDADVSGAGSVIYKGEPTERNITISGAGSVRESKIGTGEETANDTTKFQLGKRKYMIIGDESKGKEKEDSEKTQKFKHWTGYEIGVNGLLDYKNSLDVPAGSPFIELDYPKSIQFGINLMEKDFHIYKDHVNIVTGLGFDFNHYALRNSVTLDGNADVLTATSNSIKYKKNTLNVSYIKAPLLLELNSSKNPKHNMHIAFGGLFAYRIHSVAKQKYDIDDKHNKIKQRDDFNLEPFLCSLTARIGYNNVTVFADYGLNRLFKKDKGPQVYPFTIGVNISI
jgi:hypothetical protein